MTDRAQRPWPRQSSASAASKYIISQTSVLRNIRGEKWTIVEKPFIYVEIYIKESWVSSSTTIKEYLGTFKLRLCRHQHPASRNPYHSSSLSRSTHTSPSALFVPLSPRNLLGGDEREKCDENGEGSVRARIWVIHTYKYKMTTKHCITDKIKVFQ